MSPARDTLHRHLARAKRALFRRAAERTALPLVALGAALLASALVLALVATLYRGHYAALRLALVIGAGLLAAAAVRRMIREHLSEEAIAVEAGSLEPERKDEILAAFELARNAGSGTSDSLRDAAIARAASRAEALPLEKLSDWPARRRWLAIAGSSLAVALVAAVAGGPRTPVVLARIADPASAPRAPIVLRVTPGAAEIDGGATVVVRAFVRGTSSRARLLTRRGDEWVEANMNVSEATGSDAGAAAATDSAAASERPRPGERAYETRLANLKEDVHYRIQAGDAESPAYTLAVRDLPRATGYRIRYDYPAYTGLEAEETQALTGDLAAPRGTRARLEVTLSRDAATATLIGDRSGARIEGTRGVRIASFDVPMRSDDEITIRLTDSRGRRADLGPFDLRAIPDRPPTVTVLAPGVVEDVSRDMIATIVAGMTDDHGVRKVLLRYHARDEAPKIETIHEEKAGTRELAVRYTWPLQAMNLLPGEEIAYQVGAVDGNGVDGPQTTWSDERRLRFPSATEILASMQKERDETIETLEETLKGANELQQKSEELSRDIGRSRETTWEQRQQMQKTLDEQQKLRDMVDKAAQQLQQSAEKLSQSRMLNAELVQKINELQQLLNEIKDQSLVRAMQRLQEALRTMQPQDVERAMQNFKVTQDDAIKNLQRTIELLKQIRMEERMEAASERAAEMERRQIALNDSLARAKSADETKSLEANQKEIEKMTAEQKTAMDELAKDLRAMDQQASSEAQELSQQLSPQDMQQQMQEAERAMSAGERQESKERTESLQKRLQQLRKQTDQMREGFRDRKKNQLAKEMENAAQDLLDIASQQEGMLHDEESSVNDRAERQKGLEETTKGAVNRVNDIAKQTLFLAPEVGQSLGRALQNQESAVGRYSQQDLLGGLMGTKESTIALNQAATGLLKSKENMQGAKSSTGMSEAMQQLQSLAGQQQGLNEETMGMMPGQGSQGMDGRLMPGDGESLSRMAAEQEAIRQGLEEAMQKMGKGGGKPLGDMDGVANDMKGVEQDLRAGRLGQETVNKQQRILSRLLDAPRSVEKRDYSRKRMSRPGVDVVRSSPGALSPELLKSRPSLASLLAKGSRDPVTPKYRALVDEYLESLMKEGGR
ncbi:MAG TPA: hypothetical protein VFS09_01290 [Candidatus Eisenbacteria bacterium]|nr:hypothetical protein [Candidatus Eisenbacteria bacterium]